MHVFKEPSASGNVQIGNVQTIREDHRGDLWAGGLGNSGGGTLHSAHRAVGRPTRTARATPTSISGDAIWMIEEAAPGRLIALTGPEGGTKACLDRLDVATGKVRRFRLRGTSANAPEGDLLSPTNQIFPRAWGIQRSGTGAASCGSRPPPGCSATTPAPTPLATCRPRRRFATAPTVPRARRCPSRQPNPAAIDQPGDSVDLTVPFRLERTARVLLVGAGEIGAHLSADYGWVEDARGRVVWGMRYDSSAWLGGFGSHRFNVATRLLPPGTYRLRFRSDFDNSPMASNSGRPIARTCGACVWSRSGATRRRRPARDWAHPTRGPDQIPVDHTSPLAEDAAGSGSADATAAASSAGTRARVTSGGSAPHQRCRAIPCWNGPTRARSFRGQMACSGWAPIRASSACAARWARAPLLRASRLALNRGPPPTGSPRSWPARAARSGSATYGGMIHFDPATGRRQLYPSNTRQADGLGGDGISRVLQRPAAEPVDRHGRRGPAPARPHGRARHAPAP